MAARTRKLEVQISGEDRSVGKTFKAVADDAEHLGDQLKGSGEQAGKKFKGGVEDGVDENGFRGKMRGIADRVSGAFKGVLVGGAVAAGAAFTAGFIATLDQEFEVDKLEAQLGGGEWAAEMGEIAGDLYVEGFGDSIGEVGDTLRRVLQQGLLPEGAGDDAIEDLTRRFLTFTDVLDQDVGMAVQAVRSMLTSGLAPDGAAALDVLTAGIQVGTDKAEDLLETFQEYSTMFRDLGIDALDATGLMTQGLRAGARDADKVADALKEFAIRAQDASESSAEGFKAIGLNAEEMTRMVADGGPRAREALGMVLDRLREMEDPVARNAAAIALFGTQAEDLGDALFALDLDTAASLMGDVAGRTDDLSTAYDNAKTRIEVFKREAMEKLTTFVADEVIPRLEDFSEWVGDNGDKVRLFGVVLGVFIGTALLAYTVGMIQAAVATIAATWPILALVGVLGALAFATNWALQNWKWLRDAINWFLQKGVDVIVFFKDVGAAIWGFATAVWAAVQAVGGLLGKLGKLPGLLGPLGGLLGRIPIIGGLARNIPIIGGLLASGGPALAGVPYIVGEDGPELFVPRTSGMVVPADATAQLVAATSGGRGGGTTVVEVTVQGSVVAQRELVAEINRALSKGVR